MKLDGRTLAITGIGGFIGRRVTELATERGMTVIGLDIATSGVRAAREQGATEAFVGDVTDPASVRRLVKDADLVLHTAAKMEEAGDMNVFRRINVEGSRSVATLAASSGCRQMVHLSSVMVYGFDFPDGVDEDGPLRGEGNPYCQTKIESEPAVLEADEEGGFGVTVLRPGDVYGPGSRPWVERPLEMMERGLFVVPDGSGMLNPIHVDDLATAILAAFEREVTGVPINVAPHEGVPVTSYFERLGAIVGRTRIRTAPPSVLRFLFSGLFHASRLVGVDPLAAPAAVDFLRRPGRYSNARAKELLGFEPSVQLEDGMAEIEVWWNERGV